MAKVKGNGGKHVACNPTPTYVSYILWIKGDKSSANIYFFSSIDSKYLIHIHSFFMNIKNIPSCILTCIKTYWNDSAVKESL